MADCARLESVCTREGTGGSNPPLSATLLFKAVRLSSGCSAVRLAHLVWDQGVPGSNPGTPTKMS